MSHLSPDELVDVPREIDYRRPCSERLERPSAPENTYYPRAEVHVRKLRVVFPGLLLLIGALTGCFGAGHTSSPWEWGGGVRLAPGFALGEGRTTAHPMVSYTYLSFDGGSDGLFEAGGQIRQRVTPAAGSGFWVGGEAAVATLRTSLDGYNETSSSSGWSLTALAGVPVGKSRWGVNLYAGAGISDYGGSGKNIRVGMDLQPWFLKKNSDRARPAAERTP